MTCGFKNLGFTLAACGIALMPIGAAAFAADASGWSQDTHSAFRLIAGANPVGASKLRAGVEITLQPGWHTYWRYPGDSGVPPQFDFSGSENVASTTVRFPAPRLHHDKTGETIVYENNVIFPVEVTAKQLGKPVKLRLKLAYAVCEKLCVPVEGRAELALSAGASAQDAALATAEARVPKRVTANSIGLSMRRIGDGAKLQIALDLDAKSGQPMQIFVEGPTAEWALPVPTPVEGAAPGRRRFQFALDGLPSGIDPKGHFDLTVTVVEGDRAVEVKSRLD